MGLIEIPSTIPALPHVPEVPGMHGHAHEMVNNLQHGLADSPMAHATVVIAAFFIFMSISFELVRDFMHKSVPSLFQPILHALYSEMTNMGLAGIVIFLCGHAGHPPLFEQLSVWILHDPDLLLEQAEKVHMLIFLFMVVLLAFVVGSLLYVFALAKLWEITEKSVAQKDGSEAHFNSRERSFVRLRNRFVSTCDGADNDFPFYQYRKVCIMEDFCEVVNLHPRDWIVTSIILSLVWVCMTVANQYGYVVYVIFLWCLMGYSLFQYHSLTQIRHMLHPPKPIKHSAHEYGTFSTSDVPTYVALPNPHLRGKFLMWLLGPVGDKHRSLFWPGAQGPNLLRHGLRVRFLIVSITVAIMSIFYGKFLWRRNPFLLIVTALPLGAALVLLPITVSLLADVTSIEGMKRENVVQKISHEQRLQKSVAILKSLSSLTRLARIKIGSATPRSVRARNQKEEQFVKSLREMFDSINTDATGFINRDQFQELLHYFYPSVSSDEAKVLFARMTRVSQSDTVGFDETCAMMLENFAQLRGQSKQSARDMADDLWTLFDPDQKGSIVVDDVLATLKEMGTHLDMANVEAFFHEADSDRSGSLEKGEFVVFVHRHVL